MNKICLSLVVASGVLMSVNAQALDSTGCGLGSMAWRGQSGVAPQVLAVTTNVSFGNQSFGISSGTSGCDQNGRVTGGTGKMALAFLENNMEQFAMDAAAGRGETIETLAGILNVDSSELGSKTQQNFVVLFPNQNTDAVSLTLALLDVAKA